MAAIALKAYSREGTGKGPAHKLRRQGRLPAVFYGPGSKPTLLSVERRELERILGSASGENTLLELHLDSGGRKQVMLKELQVDPLKNTLLHADFYEIAMDREITVEIPIVLNNTPVGVTNGGVLETIRREIMVTCLPGKLVDSIEVDVSGMEIGDTLHIKELSLPEGISSAEDENLAVAVVSAPAAAEAEEEIEETVEAEQELPEEAAE